MSYEKIKTFVFNNRKVIENYFFMTILQILNSFFYLLIYPYLIRTLGSENYGLFVFCLSISTYLLFFINFGFDIPATKAVAQNLDNKNKVEEIVSEVLTAKTILFLISALLLFVLRYFISFINTNFLIVFIVFVQNLSFVVFPQWYFQAIQNMRIVTFIQLGIKLLSLPLIFLLVKNKNDLNIYALIVSSTTILGAMMALIIIVNKYRLKIHISDIKSIKPWLKDSVPFFLSNSAGIIKEQGITLLIGSLFGMRDVAIYDLANKIVSIPKTLFTSLNAAIFPKLIVSSTKSKIKKIINIEIILSLGVIVAIAAIGKFGVILLGGESMVAAYPMAIILSITVMVWLVVGAYINFVFVPNNKYVLVTINQLIALGSFIFFSAFGLFLKRDIIVLAWAIALSGICEMLYCKVITSKYNFL